MKYILLLIILFVIGCIETPDPYKVLEHLGFTNIELTGHRPFTCGKTEDLISMGFRAINSVGTQVEGTVCCSINKCTVW